MPSALMWAATMTGGQIGVNYWAAQAPKQKDEDDSWLRSKWSPLKKLTDKEYIEMMEEKRLKLDVEIALIDDRIADLRIAQSKLDDEHSKAGNS